MSVKKWIVVLLVVVFVAVAGACIGADLPDTTPPVVTLNSSVTGLTNALSTVLTYNSNEGTVSLTRNGTPVTVVNGGSLSLIEGRNTIVAQAVDAAGNVGTALVEINVDTLIFPPSIDALPTAWNLSSFTVTGRMEDGATIVIIPPAGAVVGTVTYPTPNAWSFTLSGLTSGSNSFSVTATDVVGNVSAQVSATLTIDLGLPPQVTGLIVANTYQGGTVTANWSAYTGPASSYALYVSSSPFTEVTGVTPWRTYPSATTSATLIGLTDNEAVYVAVVAIGAGGQSIPTVTPVSGIPTRQGLYGTVRDFVRDFPLNHMQVQVPGYPPVLTDTLGRYVLTGLPSGSYTVTIGEVGGDVRFTTRTYSGVAVAAGTLTFKNLYVFSKVHNLDCGIPGNLTATPGDGKVTLCWDALTAADLAGYIVYRDGVALQSTSVPWMDTCFTDTAVVNGTTYSYVVTSYSRGNIMSIPTNTVLATPQAVTRPPVDLTATLGCDGKVTLTWLRPAGTNLLGYNVYQSTGTTVNYGISADYMTGADNTTWTSGALAAGSTTTFAVRSVGSGGEETNTHVVVTVSVPASWRQPRAAITIPKTGKRVDGNALHVQAEAVAPTCGTVATDSVRFQYRPNGASDWLDIPAALAQHPNPDTSSPFFIKWDVTELPENDYNVRAVAGSDANSDSAPGFITITVDHHQPEFAENRAADNSIMSKSDVEKGRISVTRIEQGQVVFAPGALVADTFLAIKLPTPEQLPVGTAQVISPVDLSLTSGQTAFPAGQEVTVGFTCPDSNNDGVVDGTGYFVQDLQGATYNPATKSWELLQNAGYDTASKQITAQTPHFSLFALTPAPGLSPAGSPGRVDLPSSSLSGVFPVSWGNVDLDGRIFEVQQASDSNFTPKGTNIYSGSETSMSVGGLANGNWYYRVRTLAPGYAPSAWQTGANPVLVTLTCGSISNLQVPSVSTSGRLQLSWESSATSEVQYEVQVDDGRGFQYLTNTPDLSLSLAGLPDGTYIYRVKAGRPGHVDSEWVQSAAARVSHADTDTDGDGIADSADNCPNVANPDQADGDLNGTGNLCDTYTVTPSAGPNGTISPNSPQAVSYNGTVNFSLTPNAGYGIESVTGCNGSLSGTTYSTGPITADCTATATFRRQAPVPTFITALPQWPSITGFIIVNWGPSALSGVTFELQRSDNGGAFKPVYRGMLNSMQMAASLLGKGKYLYRVRMVRDRYMPSEWRYSNPVEVRLGMTPQNVGSFFNTIFNGITKR